MSTTGQIRDMIQGALDTLSGKYDKRLDALEADVAALKAQQPEPETAAPRKARPAAKAPAGTAAAKGDAPR